MDQICYSLHKLIEVLVETKVRDNIINAIDFQLGHFKTTKHQLNGSSQIIVKPYSDFSPDPKRTFQSVHLFRGIISQCLDDPNNRLAFEKINCGYVIYTDRRSFPINLFVQLLLIEHGISLISAAAITDIDGRVTLLPGMGGAGKSVLSLEMAKHHNYHLLGDDTVCLSEHGECLSFPRSFTIKEYHRSTYAGILQRLKAEAQTKTFFSVKATALKLMRFVRENAPLLGLLNAILQYMERPDLQAKLIPSFFTSRNSLFSPISMLAAVPIDEIVHSEKIASSGRLERIVYLERYPGNKFRVESISENSLCRRMISTIQNEWALSARLFFTMGAIEMVDIPDYFYRVEAIIRSGISKKKCDLLLIPNNATPRELLDYFFSLF